LARGITGIIFDGSSLNPGVALALLAAIYFATYRKTGDKVKARWSGLPAARQKQGRLAGWILLALVVIFLPQLLGAFLSQTLFLVGIFAIMGLGLNIVVGFAGLLDLGYVAFFAFGAYTMGLLTTATELNIGGGMGFWAALPIAVLSGVLFGVILGFPVLRLRGDYLAIVTLGFGEIIRILALSDWFRPFAGGAQGIIHIPAPIVFGVELGSQQLIYYPVILSALLAVFVSIRLRASRLGRQWMAMREDEDVAEAMGINLIQTKLLAFGIGAGFSALAGAIFVARLGNIFPHSFGLLISINALALIIVGGMGSIPGIIVGAFILVGMPELLREFNEYRLLMYGILLIVMMLVRPEGFLPETSHQRELHRDDPLAVPAGD
jgi:branched-chain amino acid transport system permease protein